MRRVVSRAGVLGAVASATLLSLGLGPYPPACASDHETSPRRVHSAAYTGGSTQASGRFTDHEVGNDEVNRLLAQGAPLTESEGSGETILVEYPLSTPESVENDVAKQHKLELVRRLAGASLNKRIVVYRIPDARAATEVVAALKADQRVSSAQPNLRYGLPRQQPPEAEISELKPSPDNSAKQEKRHASEPRPRSIAEPKSKAQPEHRRKPAQATRAAGGIPAMARSGQRGSLVAGNQAALRWPTADEPFVNLGVTNK